MGMGMGMGMGMRISGIMEDMEISGCLMISVLRSLLRRGGDECLERMRMERRTGMRRGIEEVGGVDDNYERDQATCDEFQDWVEGRCGNSMEIRNRTTTFGTKSLGFAFSDA
jgi:hypothetical protein